MVKSGCILPGHAALTSSDVWYAPGVKYGETGIEYGASFVLCEASTVILIDADVNDLILVQNW